MSNPVFSSRAELCEYVDRGGQVEYLLFWGHRPAKGGLVTKACLSQWFESAFEVDGAVYPTAEHRMMAEKARLFADDAALRRVLEAPNPGETPATPGESSAFWFALELRCPPRSIPSAARNGTSRIAGLLLAGVG